MTAYISLFVSCLLLGIFFFSKLKKDRYTLAFQNIMDYFDHFTTSIYMEQVNNKVLCRNNVDFGNRTKQEFISLLSARSFIDCTCVSVHMAVTRKDYTFNDRRYILKLIKSDPRNVKRLYDDYLLSVSKMRVKKEIYIYDGIDAIDTVSMDKFCEFMKV